MINIMGKFLSSTQSEHNSLVPILLSQIKVIASS